MIGPVVPWGVPIYVTPPIVTYAEPEQPPPVAGVVEPRPATGTLVLQVQPDTTRIFVDGYYVGVVAEFAGGLPLAVGPHKIGLNDDAREPVAFDVKILTNETITYRRVLTPLQPIASLPVASKATPPAPVYFIPGCYVGNVPPRDASLPAGCDPARAVKLN